MILATVPFNLQGKWLTRMYIKLIRESVREFVNTYDTLLINFYKIYSKEAVNEAIDNITVINGNIFIPTQGLQGEILRALEYGTSYMKAYKLISIAIRKVTREGFSDEYKFKF